MSFLFICFQPQKDKGKQTVKVQNFIEEMNRLFCKRNLTNDHVVFINPLFSHKMIRRYITLQKNNNENITLIIRLNTLFDPSISNYVFGDKKQVK